jgi:predicted 3-demethylubiquinone-9 3-methyltransferase (glyoxalase superfamily)
MKTNPIYPCLWFNGNAKEAATFYSSVFPDTIITDESPFVVNFESSGQKFMCLNGGPEFPINPSISFFVVCETIEEVEQSYEQLKDGGFVLMPLDKYPWSEKYAWVQDQFGTSWQLSFGKMEDVGQKFSPTLMFTGTQQGRAEEAIQLYTSIFDSSSIRGIARYEAGEGDVEGTVKHAQFNLGQQVFMAMDSSLPHAFGFNEGVSLVVECDTQEEINTFWNRLSEKGSQGQCGWLKDRFGVSWQIVPSILSELMSDPERSQKVMEAFMKMKKFDIEKLLQA